MSLKFITKKLPRLFTLSIVLSTVTLLRLTSLQAESQIIWSPAKDAILNYASLQKDLAKKLNVQIRMPSQVITKDGQKLYAYFSSNNDNNYQISFDTTKDCQGAKYCSMGYVSGELGGNPQIYYDLKNNEVTRPVILDANLRGYFTEAHAMADYWPPMMVWRQGTALYTVSWKIPDSDADAQEVLMKLLANYTLA